MNSQLFIGKVVLCRIAALRRDRSDRMWCSWHMSNQRRTTMSLSSHLQELKKKHQTLSENVEVMQRSPASDDIEIAKLKKQKLMLKEEISRLSAH
jgi:hypothetical protein